jgi:hypothetical protein
MPVMAVHTKTAVHEGVMAKIRPDNAAGKLFGSLRVKRAKA